MEEQILSPGVQDGGKTDLRAEVLFVKSNFLERLCRGIEQDGKDNFLIPQSQRIQFIGQGEDHMKILYWQQTFQTLVKPLRLFEALALGAMPVATGIIRDAGVAATFALILVPAQCRGSALGDVAHHSKLRGTRIVLVAVLLCVCAENVCDLQRRSV